MNSSTIATNVTHFPIIAELVSIEYGVEDYAHVIFGNKLRKFKIYTTKKGRLYINKYSRRFYMDEFMRV